MVFLLARCKKPPVCPECLLSIEAKSSGVKTDHNTSPRQNSHESLLQFWTEDGLEAVSSSILPSVC